MNYKPTEKATSYMDALSTTLDMKGHPVLGNLVNSVAHPKQTLKKVGDYAEKLDVNLGLSVYATLTGHPIQAILNFKKEHPYLFAGGFVPILASCALGRERIPHIDDIRSISPYTQEYQQFKKVYEQDNRKVIGVEHKPTPSSELQQTHVIHVRKTPLIDIIKAILKHKKITVKQQDPKRDLYQ